MNDSVRPVRLRKVVMGFPFDNRKGSDFQFDMSLNYKLARIINTYSENKPTLVVSIMWINFLDLLPYVSSPEPKVSFEIQINS